MKIATRGGWPLRPFGNGWAGGDAASASGGVTCSGAGTPECSDAPTATALHLRAGLETLVTRPRRVRTSADLHPAYEKI